MSKIFTKMQDFLNEEASNKLEDIRKGLVAVLQKANDKINKENLTVVKDGKKLKLTTNIVDGSREPRYKKVEIMPSKSAEGSAPTSGNAPANGTAKTVTPNSPSVGTVNPLYFIFNVADSKEPVANFKFTIAGKNDIEMVEKGGSPVHYNKMNMMYIPDEMQNRIEKKIGKIENA